MEFSECSNYIQINACLHKEYLLEIKLIVLKWTKMQYNSIHCYIYCICIRIFSNNVIFYYSLVVKTVALIQQ